MKLFTAFAAFTLIAAPAQAFGPVSCSGPNSGFIQVGNQVECIRQLTPEELKASAEAWNRRAARRAAARAERARREAHQRALANKRRLGREMDRAGDNILQPGGREAYRDALENFLDASVAADQLKR